MTSHADSDGVSDTKSESSRHASRGGTVRYQWEGLAEEEHNLLGSMYHESVIFETLLFNFKTLIALRYSL